MCPIVSLALLLQLVQADLDAGTTYPVTVTADSSPAISSAAVSRMILINETVPAAPSKPEGERVGSNGILLSWRMPPPTDYLSIESFVIRYKEMCPHPDHAFTEIIKTLDIPETLLNTLSPGATYNIKVAARNRAGVGPFSESLYIKTAEASPGLVTNLTAFAQNHSSVLVTWFLPVRINGLITKFAVKAKHARTGQTVRVLNINAQDIMNGALPHCNDAADILSRGTPSPSETSLPTSSVLPPVTLSAIPPASTWKVPISVGMDKLRPYTAYVFEVSGFTSDGEGQIASTMVRMPEAAPEDPPQNLSVWNMTSKTLSVSWEPPTIITGRFSYVIQLHNPAGLVAENSTSEQRFLYVGLTPYTLYHVSVRAKSAGATGPPANTSILTPAEAPGAVSGFRVVAVDSTWVRLSWGPPSQPNGLITHYRMLVLQQHTHVQNITLRGAPQGKSEISSTDGLSLAGYHDASSRTLYKRAADITMATAEAAFTISSPSLQPTRTHTSYPSTDDAHTDAHTDTHTHAPSQPGTASDLTANPSDSTDKVTLTPVTDPPPLTPGSSHATQSQRSTRVAVTGSTYQTRAPVTGGMDVLPPSEEVVDLTGAEILYVVRMLAPFTEYNFSVSAFTSMGQGPAAQLTEMTREQVPSSVQGVAYQNISSTSILVSWDPPLNPNGKITHYTVYILNSQSNQASQQTTNHTSILLTDLDTYTPYKLRVAASTAVGESPLSQEDDIFAVTPEDVPGSPPLDLAVVNTTSSTAMLSWKPPVKPNGVIRLYEVIYGNETYSNSVNSTRTSVTLRNLQPYTQYNVTVRAYTQQGHGDQSSQTLRMLSGEDVPGSAPYGLAYESLSSSEVNVSWSPPVHANGEILFYSVELWNTTHTLNITTHTTHARLANLRKYARYRLSVQAATRAGTGNHSSEILNITTLEDVPSSPPKFLIARKLSDNQVELSWQPPEEANSEILYYIVRVWNLSSEVEENVTETAVVVSVDGEGIYNASVSSWTRLGDGGVLIHVTFSTTESVPSDPPWNVSYTLLSPTSVLISWNPPTQPNGVIQYYTIYYSHNGTVDTQRVQVQDGSGPGVGMGMCAGVGVCAEVTGLSGGERYWVWLSSSTSQGDGGITSPALNFTTPEDVPSGPVHNLTAQIFSSTAVIISWDPPLEPNGRVHYLLRLQEAGTTHPSANRTTNRTITKTTTDTVFLFTKLRKHFPYVLRVTPATSAGAADNHTSELHLRTDDDIPSSPPLLGYSRNLSSSSILVSWFAPVEPNGEIVEYTVVLQGLSGSNSTYTPNTHLTLTHLTPYTPYNVSIAAVTRKGMGPSLVLQLHTDEAGPMSPPRNVSIYNHTADSVWLRWEPSLEPNGLILHYGFRILQLNTHTLTYQNSSDASTQAELHGFKPHSSYEISVCTYTKAGNGDLYSSAITFTTNESVSDAVGNLSCSGLSWDSVFLEWNPPDHPNGKILFYLIRTGDQEVRAEPHTLTNTLTHTLTHTLSGLLPSSLHTLTVAAVNTAGPGQEDNCSVTTQPESVPGAPRFLSVLDVNSSSASLRWAVPDSVPGQLLGYRVQVQLLYRECAGSGGAACVESERVVSVNITGGNESLTLEPLLKYRQYRVRVTALTNAGAGGPSEWVYTHTLAGDPDAPPRSVSVVPSSTGLKIEWTEPAVIAGPTSYLIDIMAMDGFNLTLVRRPEEMQTVVVGNLSAFTLYSVTVTAFTGDLSRARQDGQASNTVLIRTQEEEPRDPPQNMTLVVIPEEVTRVYVMFSPPDRPNGNISAYRGSVYRNGQLEFHIASLHLISQRNHTITAVIEGLRGGHNYSIRIAAVNGAGLGPSSEVQVTTGTSAPPKPTLRPQVALDRRGVVMATAKTITVQMPLCFFSDDHGPIHRVQVIVSEPAVMDSSNVSSWREVLTHTPAPYLTDEGFAPPACPAGTQRMVPPPPRTYVIGAQDNCLAPDAKTLCNGPLQPKTYYVFKFRATNTAGQYTDSVYSERVRTTDDHMLSREEQIILGVLLSFFLAVLLIIIIYASVRIHQKKKEGGTYSPREAELIETKFKLDQLIAVADMELKEEKINRYSSFFFRRKEIFVIQLLSYRKSLKPVSKKSFLQHIEELCANDNAKFQEEFAELPKLLPDLATSDADLPWNRSKNRFTNIKPYNNNRVKLLSEPGMPGSDYINASFVSGYLCPNEFIATQGPLPGTVADFWRMIWETRSRTIAMLTQCFEKGRIRCHQYWPEDNKPVTVFGDIIITKLTEDVHPDWTVRALRVERHGEYMLVQHFNYTSWPEHGVPESSSTLIPFVRAVRSNRGHDNSTIVVHCSAGVGRTGVFIALDHLMQHVRDHDFVDVYGLVAELRSERMCMVQNLAQYMFLHQSALELLSSRANSQSIWFVNYSALEKMDSLDAMEGDVELEWEETTM